MAVLDVFMLLLADSQPPTTTVAKVYLDQAQALILGYLGLQSLPLSPLMENAHAMLALVLYNRRGAEGEYKRAEGDIASWFETLPEIIRLQLRPFRNAVAVGFSRVQP